MSCVCGTAAAGEIGRVELSGNIESFEIHDSSKDILALKFLSTLQQFVSRIFQKGAFSEHAVESVDDEAQLRAVRYIIPYY